MAAAALYTPQILALAVELADYRFDPGATLQGGARSVTCGSSLQLSMTPGQDGSIASVGLMVQACAIGQAAAAIFARHAPRKTIDDVREAREQIGAWLADAGSSVDPDWPDIALLADARSYPARHGAVLLPWMAAIDALSPDAEER